MRSALLFLLLLGTCHSLLSQSNGVFQTPVTTDLLDNAAFSEWVDGKEKNLAKPSPTDAIWTQTTAPGNDDVMFGDTSTLGVRHLRIGFKKETAAGSLLVAGNVRVSFLKPGAAYPGDLGDESQWLPASRLEDGQTSSKEAPHHDFVTLWVLPADTKIRALRFSHTADPVNSFAGRLGGAFLLSGRYSNDAAGAIPIASSSADKTPLLNNGQSNFYKVWENTDNSDSSKTIASNPEWVAYLWPQPTTLRGLAFVFPGFDSVEIQSYEGDPKIHPRDAEASAWKTIKAMSGIECQYPRHLPVAWVDFEKEITTKAIRLKFTAVSKVNLHPHMQGSVRDGKRVWLGEWLALQPLGSSDLKANLPVSAKLPDVTPPIPINFTLPEDGFVTLVIENEAGQRVRNLVSETPFPKGKNTIAWDATDDLGRDTDAAEHGLYQIPSQFVAPGNYKVRGIWRKAVTPHYEFTVYNEGEPPWSTQDHVGGWLGNHSPPSAAVFVPSVQSPTGEPAVFLGCFVTEGPDGLAWVNLDGKKLGGKKWLGGAWTAAPYMARDAGTKADKDIFVYAASTWSANTPDTAELRITAVTKGEDREVGKIDLGKVAFEPWQAIQGIAVQDGLAAVSLAKMDELVFVDTNTKKLVGRSALKSPRGLAFDSEGNLLVLSENKLVNYGKISDASQLLPAQDLITSGLEDPRALTFDPEGNILVSDRGASHQVKVYSKKGKFLRAIGKPGAPGPGPYDPLHMVSPSGLTVDSKNQLWVAEDDFLPKRVSVWTLDGKFVRAIYGPSKYGGGGSLDPQDKTRFYYADEGRGTLQFDIDWEKGTSRLASVLYRPGPNDLKLARDSAAPETAFYHEGKRYFSNCYNSSPTNGSDVATLFIEKNGIAVPTAAMGKASSWEMLKGEPFRPFWPEGVNLTTTVPQEMEANQLVFIWSDKNDDGQVQPNEVSFNRGKAGGVTVLQDLSFAIAKIDEKAMRFPVSGFTPSGVPLYDFSKGTVLAEKVFDPTSSGGGQMLSEADGRGIVTLGLAPFHPRSLSGFQKGKAWWSYPSLWAGLHASHSAPEPDHYGQLIGTTRLLGGFFTAKGSEGGPMWAVNSNHGMVYLFTGDGLFVATLFKDMRMGTRWMMPALPRGTNINDLSLGDENFWPTISGTSDGKVYLLDGNRNSLIRIDGLDTIRRLPDSDLKLTDKDLKAAQDYVVRVEQTSQARQGRGSLEIAMRKEALSVDGQMADWEKASWVDIDKRGSNAYFNSDSKPYNVTGAVAVSGDRLFAAWRTGNAKLLENSGAMPTSPFKTGGALDLMIGADPAAIADRTTPVTGDSRLLVTVVGGKPMALLYRAVVAGTKDADKIPFSSPWRTITFDRVDNVTDKIQFAQADGNYEISIPLVELGLKPMAGQILKGDIGILRGNGAETTARIYWSNKATGITADVPSEAMLTPNLWGRWQFVPQP